MLKQVHYKALIDTLNNVSIQDQGSYRKVSGSSQSSLLRTAIQRFKVYAKQYAPNVYNTIRNVNSYYDLRNLQNKDEIIPVIVQLQSELVKSQFVNSQSATKTTKRKPVANIIAQQTMPNFIQLKPIVTIMKSDNYEQALQIAKDLDHSLNAYDGAMLMFNTLLNQFNFTPKSPENER